LGKAIQDTAVTPNVLVADVDDDAAAPEDEDNANPPEEEKKAAPQQDEQLHRAMEVLKRHTS
jgi:carboxyl-terminal processing protease